MRTRHLGLDDPTANPASTQAASVSGEGARISGIRRPEFPEPTAGSADAIRRITSMVEATDLTCPLCTDGVDEASTRQNKCERRGLDLIRCPDQAV
jgi:hypothetical protein